MGRRERRKITFQNPDVSLHGSEVFTELSFLFSSLPKPQFTEYLALIQSKGVFFSLISASSHLLPQTPFQQAVKAFAGRTPPVLAKCCPFWQFSTNTVYNSGYLGTRFSYSAGDELSNLQHLQALEVHTKIRVSNKRLEPLSGNPSSNTISRLSSQIVTCDAPSYLHMHT